MSMSLPPPWLRRLVVLGMGYTGTRFVQRRHEIHAALARHDRADRRAHQAGAGG